MVHDTAHDKWQLAQVTTHKSQLTRNKSRLTRHKTKCTWMADDDTCIKQMAQAHGT
jgi:hypothetical protein